MFKSIVSTRQFSFLPITANELAIDLISGENISLSTVNGSGPNPTQ